MSSTVVYKQAEACHNYIELNTQTMHAISITPTAATARVMSDLQFCEQAHQI